MSISGRRFPSIAIQAKNLAVVRISGQDSYLGKYDPLKAGRNTIAPYRRMASRRSSRLP